MIAVGLADRRMLHPIQCQLAGASAPHLQLSGEDGQHRAVAELVVVDQFLVDKGDAEPSLADQDGHPMFDLDAIDLPVYRHQGPKHCFGCRRQAVSSRATTTPEPGRRRRSSATSAASAPGGCGCAFCSGRIRGATCDLQHFGNAMLKGCVHIRYRRW